MIELDGEVYFGTGEEIFKQIKERRNPLETLLKKLEQMDFEIV